MWNWIEYLEEKEDKGERGTQRLKEREQMTGRKDVMISGKDNEGCILSEGSEDVWRMNKGMKEDTKQGQRHRLKKTEGQEETEGSRKS